MAEIAAFAEAVVADGTLEEGAPPFLKLADAQILANGILVAYDAFLNKKPLALDGFENFQPIKVYEALGDAEGSPVAPSLTYPEAKQSDGTSLFDYQLFGFTATSKDKSLNILCFRGTSTAEEVSYDLRGWGDNVECVLPEHGSRCGKVKKNFYEFYTGKGFLGEKSLAKSCMEAVEKTNRYSGSKARWLLGAHSLGGPMLSFAALEGVLTKAFGDVGKPVVVTFGSLKPGLSTFRDAYDRQVPDTYRIANLCDFVPSLVSLEPTQYAPDETYRHVGYAGTFVWQTWDNWGNHSMANLYKKMTDNLKIWLHIRWGKRDYPL